MGYSGYQPSDRAVLAGHSEITGCHLEPMLDLVSASQRSILPTRMKCPTFFFLPCFYSLMAFRLSELFGLMASHLSVFVSFIMIIKTRGA